MSHGVPDRIGGVRRRQGPIVARYTQLDPDDERIRITASLSATRDCAATFELFDFGTRSWDQVAAIPVSATESDPVFDLPINGYVNNRGIAKLRGTCTTNGGDFVYAIDQLTIRTVTPAPSAPSPRRRLPERPPPRPRGAYHTNV